MSKQYYRRNKSLHEFPKFSSKANIIQVGNEASANILFIIPIIITIQGHMFDIYSMVSEIHDSVDLVSSVKTFVQLEVEISIKLLKFKFLNRSLPVFPVHKEMFKPKEREYVKVELHFR